MEKPELASLDGAQADKPVVVIVRHPDFGNEVTAFGDVAVVDIDMGGSFDVTHLERHDLEAVASWAASHRASAAQLPEDHPARALVEEQVASVLEHLPCSPAEVESALAAAQRQWAELSASDLHA